MIFYMKNISEDFCGLTQILLFGITKATVYVLAKKSNPPSTETKNANIFHNFYASMSEHLIFCYNML